MSDSVRYDLSRLNAFVGALSDRHVVRVGIFGNKATRADFHSAVSLGSQKAKLVKTSRGYSNPSSGLTNAELGAIHEMGVPTRGIPPRSFLRMPISMKAAVILARVRETAPLAQLVKGNVVPLLKRLGIACEEAVQEAFATRGFGTWAALKRRQGSPLIDTGQLRRSIASEVVER